MSKSRGVIARARAELHHEVVVVAGEARSFLRALSGHVDHNNLKSCVITPGKSDYFASGILITPDGVTMLYKVYQLSSKCHQGLGNHVLCAPDRQIPAQYEQLIRLVVVAPEPEHIFDFKWNPLLLRDFEQVTNFVDSELRPAIEEICAAEGVPAPDFLYAPLPVNEFKQIRQHLTQFILSLAIPVVPPAQGHYFSPAPHAAVDGDYGHNHLQLNAAHNGDEAAQVFVPPPPEPQTPQAPDQPTHEEPDFLSVQHSVADENSDFVQPDSPVSESDSMLDEEENPFRSHYHNTEGDIPALESDNMDWAHFSDMLDMCDEYELAASAFFQPAVETQRKRPRSSPDSSSLPPSKRGKLNVTDGVENAHVNFGLSTATNFDL